MNINQRSIIFGILIFGIFFSGCSPSEQIIATAIDIPETAIPTSTDTPQPTAAPTGTPEPLPAQSNWKEIPIFPDALSGSEEFGDYKFITTSPARVITAYYKQEMPKQGWEIREDMMASSSSDLVFIKDNTYVFFIIKTENDKNIVFIHLVQS